jgi:flagellar biosynthesis chaperone FliJ
MKRQNLKQQVEQMKTHWMETMILLQVLQTLQMATRTKRACQSRLAWARY